VLVDYVGLLARGGDSQSPALDHTISTHILDLIALSIGPDRDIAAEASACAVRAARLQAIKRMYRPARAIPNCPSRRSRPVRG
jgi:hypothetical protein